MKTMLAELKNGIEVKVGNFTIFSYGDGTLTVRKTSNGLMGPTERPTVAGLQRLLAWMDSE